MDLVRKSLELFPEQCRQAWEESSKLHFNIGEVNNVVVCGMGGSRFTPLTVKYLYEDKIKVPYLINDTYSLPAFANEKTLVILSSYSGTTEEVLTCAKEAQSRNCKIAVISAGGNLAEMVKDKNVPAYIFNPVHNPSGQPRLAVGYMLMGHLGLLKSFKLIDVDEVKIQEAIDKTTKLLASGTKAYESLAGGLKGKIPVIIVSEHLRGFANGFANQFNENAKTFSDFRYISELNHHLMEGLSNPPEVKKYLTFIFLRSGLYSDRILKRFDLTQEVVSKQGVQTEVVNLEGGTKLEQAMEAFVLSGFTTYFLSQVYGVDPIKIPWVDYFKEKLG